MTPGQQKAHEERMAAAQRQLEATRSLEAAVERLCEVLASHGVASQTGGDSRIAAVIKLKSFAKIPL